MNGSTWLGTSALVGVLAIAGSMGMGIVPIGDRLQPGQILATQISQSNSTLQTLEQAVLTQINQYRAQRRLPALTIDPRISEQARLHSQAMASGRVPFSHDGFSQRVRSIAQVIPYRSAAENVAYNQGYRDSVTQAVQGWINSPGHRTNIEGQYDLTGIGIAQNSRGEYYFTQIFIRRR